MLGHPGAYIFNAKRFGIQEAARGGTSMMISMRDGERALKSTTFNLRLTVVHISLALLYLQRAR